MSLIFFLIGDAEDGVPTSREDYFNHYSLCDLRDLGVRQIGGIPA